MPTGPRRAIALISIPKLQLRHGPRHLTGQSLEKKHPKYDDSGEKVRNGFSDGSHSEIEVSKLHDWGPDQIRDRGLKLVRFMEKRRKLRFENDGARVSVLFLPE
jgi:hypothetical protein